MSSAKLRKVPKSRVHAGRRGTQLEPVRLWARKLEQGMSPATCWPEASVGFQDLLSEGADTPAITDGWPEPVSESRRQAWQQSIGDRTRSRSAIRVHPNEVAVVRTAQGSICSSGLFLDPHHPRMIVANEEERSRYNFLLRLDPERERDEDQVEAASWIAEMEAKTLTAALSNKYPGHTTRVLTDAKPVLLFSEVKSDDRFGEVFLSPGCRKLTAEELLPAVRAAQLGVHVGRK